MKACEAYRRVACSREIEAAARKVKQHLSHYAELLVTRFASPSAGFMQAATVVVLFVLRLLVDMPLRQSEDTALLLIPGCLPE